MKNQDSVPLTVKILGREFQVACPRDERDDLLASARYLDDRMQAIRKRAAGLGIERIAVMAALNMSREMLQMERDGSGRNSAAALDGLDLDLDSADAPDEDDRAHQMALRIDAELGTDS